MRPQPPTVMDDLWPMLRWAGLRKEQLRRLAAAWEEGPVRPRLDQLVQAGLLTAYQAEQILLGKRRRLRLGPYRILDYLGAGGMGQVYKAEHVLMKRLVALKVLGRAGRRKAVGDSPGQALFRGELETAGRLAHPHIVAAYDAARLRGRIVLVMEYVDGIDLERLVTEAGPLPVPLACEVVRQAALALGYLHGRGLVHRDVKPANLLLVRGPATAQGAILPDGPPLIKLVDLGLACRAGREGEAAAEPGQLCGTMDYIPPERGMGNNAANIRGDLYSLGCTFYQLLTGRVPFPGGSWTGKLLRHRLEVPEPVQALRLDAPDDVAGVVRRLMARNPEERFPDPSSLVEALDHLRLFPSCKDPVPPVNPTPPAPAVRRLLGLGPWVLVATILTGGTVGGVARVTLSSSAQEDRPTPFTPARAARTGVVVSGIDHSFADLASAVAAARDGATLTLHGEGPFRIPPLDCRGKAITIRAAPGVRPVVERLHAPGAIFDALLFSDRPLTLEGLELRGGGEEVAAPVVSVEQATLRLRDCGVRGGGGPLLALRRGQSLHVEDCRLGAAKQAIAVEIEAHRPCSVRVRQSHIDVRDLTGAALLLWSADRAPATSVTVDLTGSTLHAGRMVACRSIVGPIDLTAVSCRLAFHQALLSFDGYGNSDAWRKALRWTGRDNRFDRAGPWLRLEGVVVPAESKPAWAPPEVFALASSPPSPVDW